MDTELVNDVAGTEIMRAWSRDNEAVLKAWGFKNVKPGADLPPDAAARTAAIIETRYGWFLHPNPSQTLQKNYLGNWRDWFHLNQYPFGILVALGGLLLMAWERTQI